MFVFRRLSFWTFRAEALSPGKHPPDGNEKRIPPKNLDFFLKEKTFSIRTSRCKERTIVLATLPISRSTGTNRVPLSYNLPEHSRTFLNPPEAHCEWPRDASFVCRSRMLVLMLFPMLVQVHKVVMGRMSLFGRPLWLELKRPLFVTRRKYASLSASNSNISTETSRAYPVSYRGIPDSITQHLIFWVKASNLNCCLYTVRTVCCQPATDGQTD